MHPPSRVLLLSAFEPRSAADTDLVAVIADVLAALRGVPGCAVLHRAVTRLSDVREVVRAAEPDVVFNLCEAIEGRSALEPDVARALEEERVHYTGNDARCLELALRKHDAAARLRGAGVPAPASARVSGRCRALPEGLRYPVMVKPDEEDGSVAIHADSVVTDDASLARAVERVLDEVGSPAQVEEYIEGREIAVAMLGWPEPRLLPPGEILFDDETFAGRARVLTYASKWEEGSKDWVGTRSVRAELDADLSARVSEVARAAFSATGMRDYGRVDMRVDADGRPFVIDVNPNCDLSREGGFALAARRAGLDHAALVSEIVRGALRRAGHERPSTREVSA